jgi:hypothetical protein
MRLQKSLLRESCHVDLCLTNRMAASLPPPLNRILGLWLPPDFAQKQENTLGYVLRQDTLTWETLVVSPTCNLRIES